MAEYQGKRFKKTVEAPLPATRPAHMGTTGGPRRRGPERRRRRVFPFVLMGIGLILLLVAGGILVHAFIGYRQAEDAYGALQENVEISDAEGGIPRVDFDALEAINPDTVGWIYVPGTNINYPVVQGDDNTTYLTRLFDGSGNGSGTIFLDKDGTAPGMVDQQTTLYGHHMNNRTMFYEIDDTQRQENFDKIEVAYYVTRDTTYICTPLMTSVVEETFVDARQPNFVEDESLADYLLAMLDKASASADDANERIAQATRVLTLVTCNWEIAGDNRSVMVLSVDDEIPSLGSDSAGVESE